MAFTCTCCGEPKLDEKPVYVEAGTAKDGVETPVLEETWCLGCFMDFLHNNGMCVVWDEDNVAEGTIHLER